MKRFRRSLCLLPAALLLVPCWGCERRQTPSPPVPVPPPVSAPAPSSSSADVPSPQPGPPLPSASADKEKSLEKSTPAEPTKAAADRKLEVSEWWEDRENFYLKAKDLLRQGKKDEALDLLEDVIALDPGHEGALMDKAEIYREQGRSEEMIPDLEASLEASPGNANLLQELALSYLAAGNPSQALAIVDKAITEKAAVPGARYARAVILAEMKDAEGALRALSDAVQNGYLNLPVFEREDRFRFVSEDPRYQDALAAMRKFQEAVQEARKRGAEAR